MEAAPPTYEKAIAPQKWELIAPYLPINDLCSVALVCKQWHNTFSPFIWGDPSSHFGSESGRIHDALIRFRHTLPWARPSVRLLTHTLRIPPVHADIYDAPLAEWLKDALDLLPSLQSLIVRGVPFFDHASLSALRYPQSAGRREDPLARAFGLRLLDASRCVNATARGLSYALDRFPFMLYLDLSFTYSARDPAVLKSLRLMTGLQVLKLRGISLRDEDVEVLARAISTRVRALDVRNNQLTDRGGRTLLKHSVAPRAELGTSRTDSRETSMLQYLGPEMLAIYRGEQYESYLRKAFTTGFVDRLAIEDTPESGTGITHLSISDNQITLGGASTLIKSGRLHVLDLGLVKSYRADPSFIDHIDDLGKSLSGSEMLTRVLAEAAGDTLTFLRVDHRLITKEPSAYDVSKDLPGHPWLPNTSGDSTHKELVEVRDPAAYQAPPEFDAGTEPPGYARSVPAEDAPPYTFEDELPEAVDSKQTTAPEGLDSPQITSNPQFGLNDFSAMSSASSPLLQDAASLRTRDTHHEPRLASHTSGRNTRIKTRLANGRFHPGILPRLTKLVLTNVPPYCSTPSTVDRLIAFIHDCADEARLARLQADTTRSGRQHSQTHSPQLFSLREIVLEMARDDTSTQSKAAAGAWKHHDSKSVTQDPDSDALASAAAGDFSFFGDDYDGDVAGLKSGSAASSTAMSGLKIGGAQPPASVVRDDERNSASPARIDVIARIAEFRRAKKAAYEAALACGEIDPWIQGYWDGNIKVVRPLQVSSPIDQE